MSARIFDDEQKVSAALQRATPVSDASVCATSGRLASVLTIGARHVELNSSNAPAPTGGTAMRWWKSQMHQARAEANQGDEYYDRNYMERDRKPQHALPGADSARPYIARKKTAASGQDMRNGVHTSWSDCSTAITEAELFTMYKYIDLHENTLTYSGLIENLVVGMNELRPVVPREGFTPLDQFGLDDPGMARGVTAFNSPTWQSIAAWIEAYNKSLKGADQYRIDRLDHISNSKTIFDKFCSFWIEKNGILGGAVLESWIETSLDVHFQSGYPLSVQGQPVQVSGQPLVPCQPVPMDIPMNAPPAPNYKGIIIETILATQGVVGGPLDPPQPAPGMAHPLDEPYPNPFPNDPIFTAAYNHSLVPLMRMRDFVQLVLMDAAFRNDAIQNGRPASESIFVVQNFNVVAAPNPQPILRPFIRLGNMPTDPSDAVRAHRQQFPNDYNNRLWDTDRIFAALWVWQGAEPYESWSKRGVLDSNQGQGYIDYIQKQLNAEASQPAASDWSWHGMGGDMQGPVKPGEMPKGNSTRRKVVARFEEKRFTEGGPSKSIDKASAKAAGWARAAARLGRGNQPVRRLVGREKPEPYVGGANEAVKRYTQRQQLATEK
jgi:hypothetical protein